MCLPDLYFAKISGTFAYGIRGLWRGYPDYLLASHTINMKTLFINYHLVFTSDHKPNNFSGWNILKQKCNNIICLVNLLLGSKYW